MRADERHSRELSEQLHDGPLQNLLAARLDLDELRDNPHRRVSTGSTRRWRDRRRPAQHGYHAAPRSLAQVGLSASVRDVAQRCEQRWGTPVETDIEGGETGGRSTDHRAARELLTNAHKHSRASRITVSLRRGGGQTVLRVADDGIG